MTLATSRRELILSVILGCYAALIAVVPSIEAKAALCAPLFLGPLVWWMLRDTSRWLAVFFLIALLTPPLPIAIGDSGPHLALFVAACGLLIGVIHARSFHFAFDKVTAAIFALFGALLASVFMAAMYSTPGIAAGSLARVLLFGISVYVFLYVRGSLGEWPVTGTLRLLFWAAVGSAAFACLDFYFQFPAPAGYGPQFIWLESGVFRRAQGFFYEAGTLGNFCAFFLEMIAVALFRPRHERPLSWPAMALGGSLLGAALVLSYSRASLVNLGVALVVLLWLNRKRIRLGRVFGSLTILAFVIVILAFAFPVFTEAYLARIATAQYFFESPNGVLSGRIQHWGFLTNFLMTHPWHALLGVGYKTLAYSDFAGTAAIADNTYLSMLIETGVLGFAALLALNFTILRAAHRATNSADSRRSFCGTWIFCFWCGQIAQMFSVDLLTYWRVLPVYFCVLALAVKEAA